MDCTFLEAEPPAEDSADHAPSAWAMFSKYLELKHLYWRPLRRVALHLCARVSKELAESLVEYVQNDDNGHQHATSMHGCTVPISKNAIR